MKYPHAPRTALGLMICLLAPLSVWAAPSTAVENMRIATQTARCEARHGVSPAKEILAWHRVGSPGSSRESALGRELA